MLKQKNKEIEDLEQEQEQLVSNLSKTRAKMIKFRDSFTHNPAQDSIDQVLAEVDQLRMERDSLQRKLDQKQEEVDRLRKNLAKYIYKGPKKPKNSTSSPKPGPRNGKVRNFNNKED